MKGLLKRSCNFLLKPRIMIVLSGFLALNIVVPILVCIFDAPHKRKIFFGYRDALESLSAFSVYMYIFLALIVVYITYSMIKYDETTKWNMYLAATPINRRKYVAEKYITGLLTVVFLSLSCSVPTIAGMIFRSDFQIKDYILTIASLQLFEVLIMSVLLMLMIRFGATQGLVVYLFLTVGITISVLLIMSALLYSRPLGNFIRIVNSAEPLSLAIIIFMISLSIFGVSFLFSVKFYKKREF